MSVQFPKYYQRVLNDCGSDTVREIMRTNARDGFQFRWSGRRKKLQRKNLVSLGVFHEVNMDGHEKLSSQALKMGPASIPIYAGREKYSGAILRMECVPDARQSIAVGHFYIDLIEDYGDEEYASKYCSFYDLLWRVLINVSNTAPDNC